MTTEELIQQANGQRTGPMAPDAFSAPVLGEMLRFVLSALLADIDYEASKESGSAIAARALAAMISGADEVAEKESLH